jgi:murein L,D-transpeptidase YcbB/YkuD
MKSALALPAVILILGLAVIPVDAGAAENEPDQGVLRKRVERLSESEDPSIEGARIAALSFIESFYQQRAFDLAWRDGANRDVLLAAIAASPNDGLNPKDFHVEAIERLWDQLSAAPNDQALRADLDIVLTEALVRLGYQLFYGKLDPEGLDADWNFVKPLLAREPVHAVASALESGALLPFLSSLRLEHPYYLTLKAALRNYREIESTGGWPVVPEGPSLKPGVTNSRVGGLRRRLAASGHYDGTGTTDTDLYDPTLEAAVREFQDRHGLSVDGVIGPTTLAELNVPVEDRIDQIRANMERARWVLRNLGEDFIVVNIAGFYARVVRGGDVAWQTRAIVGKLYRKTPVFTADMSYLVLNPTWTVPPTILKKDILPKVKADPNYLTERNFQLVNRDGEVVDPRAVDWSKLTANGFPYQIVQGPGPSNALGLVKFMFPNKHFVYLHDTPSREYFKSSQRAFSSGCIRVDKPFELVQLLLGDQPDWNQHKVAAAIQAGETKTIHLKQTMPVLLLYWTVDPDPGGDVRFYRDIYERDREIIERLDSEFRIQPKS